MFCASFEAYGMLIDLMCNRTLLWVNLASLSGLDNLRKEYERNGRKCGLEGEYLYK